MHAVEQLLASLADVEPYPPGIVGVPELIAGIAFFPGGSGLWTEDGADSLPAWPRGGVMVLGHDFDSERGYAASRTRGHEVGANKTWRELVPVLEKAGIARERCFFTNAFMGLRAGLKATGPYAGAADAGFVERCRTFFLRQVVLQEPIIILALGSGTPAFLAPLAPSLANWRGCTTFAAIDRAGPVATDVRFPAAPSCAVVTLTHPSFRTLNVARRRFEGLSGNAAEVAMLRQAAEHTEFGAPVV